MTTTDHHVLEAVYPGASDVESVARLSGTPIATTKVSLDVLEQTCRVIRHRVTGNVYPRNRLASVIRAGDVS